jgi:lipopolysaccharide/colanic/teichoic acid biosynthesis glycosyltransferase
MTPLPRRRTTKVGIVVRGPPSSPPRADRRVRKRVFDLLIIGCLSPVILILLFGATAIAVFISLGTGESLLFPQERLGQHGRVFRMWKFRTMISNRPGAEVTSVGDHRVAPMGPLLRRPHLDELPQLWNVLRGEMSLVGPRPEQPALARKYTLASPEFALRLQVPPGITGWAQVRGGYAGDHAESLVKLAHDLYYIEHQTLALDASILARTMVVMASLGGR